MGEREERGRRGELWGLGCLFGGVVVFYFSGIFLHLLQLDAASSEVSKLYFIDLTGDC